MLRRWEPFREIGRMNQEMRNMWPRWFFPNEDGEVEDWTIPLDVYEEDDNIVVHAAVPGMKPEDIEVTVEENILTTKGKTEMEKEHKDGDYLMRERHVGAFHRTLRLPKTVESDRAETTYEHGVLTITLPMLEAKKARHIPVTVGEASEAGKN